MAPARDGAVAFTNFLFETTVHPAVAGWSLDCLLILAPLVREWMSTSALPTPSS